MSHGYLLQCIRAARHDGVDVSVQLPSAKPSAFALPGFHGRFYALCPHLAWLWAACSCYPLVESDCKQIRIYDNEERSVVLQARDKMHTPEAFEVGDWVRIRFGRYRGDLGRVREVKKGENDAEENDVVVAVVPRIRVAHKRSCLRPDAALFNPTQNFGKIKPVSLPGCDRFMLKKRVYANGLAEIQYSPFQITKTKPSLVDLGAFLETETSLGYLDGGEPFLQVGDKVLDMNTGLRGRVNLIEGDIISLAHKVDERGSYTDIDAYGYDDASECTSRCSIKSIRRLLERGTQIRVMVGKLEGQIGMVLCTRQSDRMDMVQFLSGALEPVRSHRSSGSSILIRLVP